MRRKIVLESDESPTIKAWFQGFMTGVCIMILIYFFWVYDPYPCGRNNRPTMYILPGRESIILVDNNSSEKDQCE